MKKRISLFLCVLVAAACLLTLGTFAASFSPDSDGEYTVPLSLESNSQYILFVLKGEYDQTNYIEAFNNADDGDILYFEQAVSDENGRVIFGPFVPNGYYASTLIVGGTNYDEPVLAGHLSVEGVSNTASIQLSGIENSYTVKGSGNSDYVVDIKAEVLDSFGYSSVTGEEVTFELSNNSEGVTLDGNVLTISAFAKAQTFTLKAKAATAEKVVFIQVKREDSVAKRIVVYTDNTYSKVTDGYIVDVTATSHPSITVYAKTLDQYNEQIEDSYRYTYCGESVGSTFTPVIRNETLLIESMNGSISAFVSVSARLITYKDSAFELYNLINTCREKLSEDKNISVDGKDVFPGNTWTTEAAVDALRQAISTADVAIRKYNTEGYTDTDYVDEVTALNKALSAYNGSFKDGIRRDVDTISLKEYSDTITVNATLTLEAVTSPKIGSGLATDVLTWTSSDESVVTVTPDTTYKAVVKGVASGTATVTVTTRGGLTASAEITVIKKATDIVLSTNSTTATFRGEPVVLKAQLKPTGCTDIITWNIDKPDVAGLEYNEYIDENGFRCIEATVIPKSAGKVEITVNAQYGEKRASKEITVVMPEWETALAPKANIASGSIIPGTSVVLSAETANTQIYYTLDGTTPSRTNGRLYKNPVVISQSLTLKAVAVGDNLYDSDVVTYEYIAVNSSVWATKVTVASGSDAVVMLRASDFENAKNVTIVVEYDAEHLSLGYASVEEVDGATIECVEEAGKLTVTLVKEDGINFGKYQDVASLYFSVDETAPEGEYTVAVTEALVELVNGKTYQAAVNDGSVRVKNYLAGDVNDDGTVGLADVLTLKKYLAHAAGYTFNEAAADVDDDGDVDNDDLILLSKYCTGWDVKLGEKPESGYMIVANYDLGQDDDGLWRNFYEVYDPSKATKVYDVVSAAGFEKASSVPAALETGAIVRVSADGTIDESVTYGTADFANLVWIKSADENSMTVVPYDDTAKCKTCADAYVEDYNGTSFDDLLGNTCESNVVKITSATKFSAIKYSALTSNPLKWGTMNALDYSDVIVANKNVLSYNDKSEDANFNYKTTYASYVKAFVCVNNMNEAEFVIVVVNGDDAAAYNVPCEDCQ